MINDIAFHFIMPTPDLNMDDILNYTGNDGTTLFSNAALFSESLANELIKKNVVVTTVNNMFQIPPFRVS